MLLTGVGPIARETALPAPCTPLAAPRALATSGLSIRRCSTGWRWQLARAATREMSPTVPAAGSAWPASDFADASRSGWLLPRAPIRAAAAAPVSMGSPSGVPVPCTATNKHNLMTVMLLC